MAKADDLRWISTCTFGYRNRKKCAFW